MAIIETLEITPAVISHSRSIYRVVIDLTNKSVEVDWKYFNANGEYINKTREDIITGDEFLELASEKAKVGESLCDFIKRVLYAEGAV
jgi:hypothetical protein